MTLAHWLLFGASFFLIIAVAGFMRAQFALSNNRRTLTAAVSAFGLAMLFVTAASAAGFGCTDGHCLTAEEMRIEVLRSVASQ
jgi:hypothetical protein